MRLLAILIVVLLASPAAAEITCDQVRACVASYGVARCKAVAIAAGATKDQIEQARACLRKKSNS